MRNRVVSIEELMAYMHASCCCPLSCNCEQALDSYGQALGKVDKRKGKGLIGINQFPVEVEDQMVDEHGHF